MRGNRTLYPFQGAAIWSHLCSGSRIIGFSSPLFSLRCRKCQSRSLAVYIIQVLLENGPVDQYWSLFQQDFNVVQFLALADIRERRVELADCLDQCHAPLCDCAPLLLLRQLPLLTHE